MSDDSLAPRLLVAETEDAGLRCDVFLAARAGEDISRAKAKQWLDSGAVTRLRDGTEARPKPSDTVRPFDVFRMEEEAAPPEPTGRAPLPAPHIKLDVLLEDEELLVINKPAGLTVHPGAGSADDTVVNALLAHTGGNVFGLAPERAGVVHRLDRETTGVMLLAKTERACRRLSEMIKAREVTRIYVAVTKGVPVPGAGSVDAPIGRHPVRRKEMSVRDDGRRAVTHFRTLETFMQRTFALIECTLETGRTHQIRVHMRHIGHPLIGDPVYGPRALPLKGTDPVRAAFIRSFKRQALHAARLGFVHPFTGAEHCVEAPLPQDMNALIQSLRDR